VGRPATDGKAEGAALQNMYGFLKPLVPTRVFRTYWYFVTERQRIFFRRLENATGPWTNDPILREYKFTNVYRASDRTSQYLIRRVIYAGAQEPREVFFRTLLFKFFNRIETWELLENAFGEISSRSYSFEHYNAELCAAMSRGRRIYSAAYIMPSGGGAYARKHEMHLRLLEKMVSDEVPARIGGLRSMKDAFGMIRAYPTIGDFLGYQYITDLNYGNVTNFTETEFVVAGPGARDGLRKCFSSLGGMSEAEAIALVCEAQEECLRAEGSNFLSLWGRPMQLIDAQNVFCEVDKYARQAHPEFVGRTGRVRIKQRFQPSVQGLRPWYPPKWGLNAKLSKVPKSDLDTGGERGIVFDSD